LFVAMVYFFCLLAPRKHFSQGRPLLSWPTTIYQLITRLIC
jgi:hypothetical protein